MVLPSSIYYYLSYLRKGLGVNDSNSNAFSNREGTVPGTRTTFYGSAHFSIPAVRFCGTCGGTRARGNFGPANASNHSTFNVPLFLCSDSFLAKVIS